MTMRWFSAAVSGCMASLLPIAIGMSFSPQVQAEWGPTQSVEIVVASGPGGSNDLTARMIHQVITANKLIPVSSAVVNKPGGGGARAYAYLNQFSGNAHRIAITTTAIITNPITGRDNVTHRMLTPLAHLFSEPVLFMVRPDSKIRDARDLLRRLSNDPQSVSIAVGASRVNANGIAVIELMKRTGLDPKRAKMVLFSSGGESLSALLGGHVDLMVVVASGGAEAVSSKQVRGLAITAPRPLEGELSGVPTWRQFGVDITTTTFRGLIAPQGITREQIAYWNGVIAKMVQAPEFREFARKTSAVVDYKDSNGTLDYLNTLEAEYTTLLTEVGLARPRQ